MKPYYSHAGITIYCGDCREILPELMLHSDAKFDLVLTDPPYGILKRDCNWGHRSELQWDGAPATNVDAMIAHSKNQIIWGGNYLTLRPSRGWLVWYKRDAVPSAADVELAWTSQDMNSKLIDHPIAATNAERNGHPTQKPRKVMVWSLSFFPKSQSVLDPYCGSGTTLLAAKQLGKSAIGIEIEEKYCEIAAKRLSQEVFDFQEPVRSEKVILGTGPTMFTEEQKG